MVLPGLDRQGLHLSEPEVNRHINPKFLRARMADAFEVIRGLHFQTGFAGASRAILPYRVRLKKGRQLIDLGLGRGVFGLRHRSAQAGITRAVVFRAAFILLCFLFQR